MEFEEYLISKKIDPEKFKSSDQELYQSYSNEFSQMHPNSFTAQKLFAINQIRRKYLLEKVEEKSDMKKTAQPKPKLVARPTPKPKV